MKKLFIFIVLFLTLANIYGQETVLGTYNCSYLDKKCGVAYSERAESYFIYISSGKNHDDMSVIVNNKDIQEFRDALTAARDKYVEWTKVAKENNVKSFNKYMDIEFPEVKIMWGNKSPQISLGAKPEPRFMVNDGEYRLLLFSGKKVAAFDNEYITEQAYWIFLSVDEINQLLKLISPETLNKKIESKAKTDALFH